MTERKAVSIAIHPSYGYVWVVADDGTVWKLKDSFTEEEGAGLTWKQAPPLPPRETK